MTDKEIKKLIKDLRKQGFEVSETGPHHKVYKDGRRIAVLPKTPSDGRARKNILAELRRHGFDKP